MSRVVVPIFDEINAKFHLFYQKVIVLTIYIEFKNNLLSLFCSKKQKKPVPWLITCVIPRRLCTMS